jgi:hypothetical protein
MKEVEKTSKDSASSCGEISISATGLTKLAEVLKGTVKRFTLKE